MYNSEHIAMQLAAIIKQKHYHYKLRKAILHYIKNIYWSHFLVQDLVWLFIVVCNSLCRRTNKWAQLTRCNPKQKELQIQIMKGTGNPYQTKHMPCTLHINTGPRVKCRRDLEKFWNMFHILALFPSLKGMISNWPAIR